MEPRGARRLWGPFFRPHSLAPLLKSVKKPCKISTSWCRCAPRRLVTVRRKPHVFRVSKQGIAKKQGINRTGAKVRNEAGSHRFSAARPQATRGTLQAGGRWWSLCSGDAKWRKILAVQLYPRWQGEDTRLGLIPRSAVAARPPRAVPSSRHRNGQKPMCRRTLCDAGRGSKIRSIFRRPGR
jgi:hypothetical protein